MAEKILKKIPLNQADAILLPLAYDRTASFGKGAVNGPKKIISCFDKLEFYERFTETEPGRKINIVAATIIKLNHLKPEQMVKTVSDKTLKIIKLKKFIIGLGGEHSVTIGILDAWKKITIPKNVTVLSIDAHFDLRNDDSDYSDNYSKFAHSCVMRRAHEMGFNVNFSGIRLVYKKELDYADKNKLKYFSWPQAENIKIINKIIQSIKTKNVYLSLDVDGIDPSFMPATGTPVQGGLSWYFTLDLIKKLFQKKNIIGADIVEVAPRPHDNLTEFGAAFLAYYMVGLRYY